MEKLNNDKYIYPHSSIYKIGDFVQVLSDEELKITKIGKIEEIFKDSDDTLIRFNVFAKPETLDIKEDYFSDNELIRLDEKEKEFLSSIIKKIDVVNYDTYLKLKLSNSLGNNSNEVLFYRQKYSNDLLLPELDSLSCCGKVLNPDLDIYQCPECKNILHSDCILSKNLTNCILCCSNIKITSSGNDNVELLKRKRNFEGESLTALGGNSNIKNTNSMGNFNNVGNLKVKTISIEDQINIKNKKPIIINQDNNKTIGDNNNKSFVNSKKPPISVGLHPISSNTDDKKEYANLPEENRQYLINLIKKLNRISTTLAQTSMTSDEKTRKIIRDELVNTFVSTVLILLNLLFYHSYLD